jgi:RNA polymerase sigma factor (sigma-70 family)
MGWHDPSGVHASLNPRRGGPRPAAPDPSPAEPGVPRSDASLVRGCLRGRDDDWAALLDKYQRLIFSIPVRQGIPRDDAADIFQRVCLLLLAELPHLRQAKALPLWLIRVTASECSRWRRQERPWAAVGESEDVLMRAPDTGAAADDLLARAGDEQVLREATASLPPRCRQLVQMLFYETPARPYKDVAEALGLAAGSIGFIRGRCLGRLRRELERRGFR